MRHDYRDEGGMYRCCTPAETRAQRARQETQTHRGPFTHERVESDRRMNLDVTVSYDGWKRFEGQRVNREPHHPKVTK